MSDVNSERTRHEARESVGNRPPREGETRTEAAMRRYLGAEMFDELHHPAKKAPEKAQAKRTSEKEPSGKAAEKAQPAAESEEDAEKG